MGERPSRREWILGTLRLSALGALLGGVRSMAVRRGNACSPAFACAQCRLLPQCGRTRAQNYRAAQTGPNRAVKNDMQ
jgi:hypothetical protein